jgi:hypothetical protein
MCSNLGGFLREFSAQLCRERVDLLGLSRISILLWKNNAIGESVASSQAEILVAQNGSDSAFL